MKTWISEEWHFYLCTTKNGGFWNYWPPGRNLWVTVPQPWLNESQSKTGQGSLWVPLRVTLHSVGGTWRAQWGAAASTRAGASTANGAGNPRCRKSNAEYSHIGRGELLSLPANTFPFWTSGILWFASTDSAYGESIILLFKVIF